MKNIVRLMLVLLVPVFLFGNEHASEVDIVPRTVNFIIFVTNFLFILFSEQKFIKIFFFIFYG